MFIVNMFSVCSRRVIILFYPPQVNKMVVVVCLFVCFGVTRLISFLTRDLMVYQERMENLESSELW